MKKRIGAMKNMTRIIFLMMLGLAAVAYAEDGQANDVASIAFDPIDRFIPADAMAVYFGRPSPDMIDVPTASTMQGLSWLTTFKSMGVIPRDGRVAADIVASGLVLWRRPHAVVLLDFATSQVHPDVSKLEKLQIAVVIASNGIEQAIEWTIRDQLRSYTDADNGTLNTRVVDGITVNRLIDKRLPEWTVIEWGRVGNHFVLTLGEGAFARMMGVIKGKQPSLADEPWFKQAHVRTFGATSGIEIYADAARIRDHLGEEMKDRPAAVLAVLGIRDAEKFIWTTGHDERAIRGLVIGKMPTGRDEFITLSGRETAVPEVAAVIPGDASSYMVLRMPIGQVIRDIRSAYYESQGPGQQSAVHELWTWLQKEYRFDSETQVLDQLGDHLVVHTYPPHPLRLPGLCTIWLQIHGNSRQEVHSNSQQVAHAVDAMMQAWQDSIEQPESMSQKYREYTVKRMLSSVSDVSRPASYPETTSATSRPVSRSETTSARRSRSGVANTARSTATRSAATQPAAARPARDSAPQPSMFSLAPRVRREPDGVWVCQLGVINPALAVTDGWIIVSWSPEAVRANLQHLGQSPLRTPAE